MDSIYFVALLGGGGNEETGPEESRSLGDMTLEGVFYPQSGLLSPSAS